MLLSTELIHGGSSLCLSPGMLMVVLGGMEKMCVLLKMKQDPVIETQPFWHLGPSNFCS